MVLVVTYGLKIREIQIKTSDQDHAGACLYLMLGAVQV